MDDAFSVDEFINDKLKGASKKNETITAIMSYKKGEHLKLIPFFKPPLNKKYTVLSPT